jgi:hypothetical protein
MSRRSRIVGFGSAALLVAAGGVCAAVFAPVPGEDLALVLISLGAVLAVSLVFFEVGLSEDRDRAREQAAPAREAEVRASEAAPRAPDAEVRAPEEERRPHPPEEQQRRPRRTRLERTRGHPRRLR